jgi:hypothetical protein
VSVAVPDWPGAEILTGLEGPERLKSLKVTVAGAEVDGE